MLVGHRRQIRVRQSGRRDRGVRSAGRCADQGPRTTELDAGNGQVRHDPMAPTASCSVSHVVRAWTVDPSDPHGGSLHAADVDADNMASLVAIGQADERDDSEHIAG